MLSNIQKKAGTVPDGIFGRNTANAIMKYYKLSPTEAAHFLGQCYHETGGFKIFEENLNYSAQRLLQVFPKYFKAPLKITHTKEELAIYNSDARALVTNYAYNPQLIANRVYANRMGNGDEASGEGWKYRGRGAIQLTGKQNYEWFVKWFGKLDVFCNPDLVATEFPLESAKFYFERNNIFSYCKDVSEASILKVSRAVNIGNPTSYLIPHGMSDRRLWTLKIYSWLI